MGIYNLNSVYFGSQLPIRNLNPNNEGFSSNPISANESASNNTGGISKEYSAASRSLAIGQIAAENSLKSDTTAEEYIQTLIKQGKIPNKNFVVDKDKCSTLISEINSSGQKIKETTFLHDENSKRCIGTRYYNPETAQMYKWVNPLSQGYVSIDHYDPKTGEQLYDEVFNPEGSLIERFTYKKLEKGEKRGEESENVFFSERGGVDYKVSIEKFSSVEK